MKICPYNIDKEVRVVEVEHNEEGFEVKSKAFNQTSMMICLEEKCAVWENGKCGYMK